MKKSRLKPSELKLEIEYDETREQVGGAVALEKDWQEGLDGQETYIEEEVEESLDEKWRDFGERNDISIDQEFSLDEPLQSDASDNSDSNTERNSLKFISHDLGNRIILEIPSQFSQKVKNLQTSQLGVISRNEVIEKINIGTEEIYCTDIYELFDSTKTRKKYSNEKFDVLTLPKQFAKHIKIKIPISNIGNIECFTFYAHVFSKSKWTKIEGELLQHSKSVNFHANALSKFCITFSPKVEEAVLNPHEEFHYVSCQDSRTRVFFPQDCVEKSEQINFMIIPGDVQGTCWRRENNPEHYNVRAISHCLYVKHDVRRFLKQISVTLPINEEQDDCDLVFFRKKGDSIEIIDLSSNETIRENGECCSIDVSGFSRYQAARIKPGSSKRVSNLEVELSMGLKKVCSILLFMKKGKANYLTIWIEVTTKEKRPEVAEKRKSMGFIEILDCRSGDIFLKDVSKIRIDVKGCIKTLKDTPKEIFFLTFISLSEDNHTTFPVQIYPQISDHPYAIISFTESAKSKKLLHSAHFDPTPRPVPKPAPKTHFSNMNKMNNMNISQTQIPSSPIKRSKTFSGFNNTTTKEVQQDFKEDKKQLPTKVKKNTWMDLGLKSKDKSRSVDKISDDNGDIQMGSESNLSFPKLPQYTITTESHKKGNTSLQQSWTSNVFQDRFGETSSDEYSSRNMNYYPTVMKGKDAFFSDRSMSKLAQRLTSEQCCNLAIELGLSSIEIDHIKRSSHFPDIVETNLKMIQTGLSKTNRKERLDMLIEALYETDLRHLAKVVEKVANEGRSLIKNDFE